MKIKYLGHSSFSLISQELTTIVTDPFNDVGYEMPEVAADAVTISHGHYDHSAHSKVKSNPIIIDTAESFVVKDISVNGFYAYHDQSQGQERGKVIVYKYKIDGLDICHLGDIGQDIDAKLLDSIMPVNILLIPVGGKYTIDAHQAKEYVDKIMPDVVIPMHYKTEQLNIDISKVSDFTELFEDYQVIEADSDAQFSKEDIHGSFTEIIVMQRFQPENKSQKGGDNDRV